MLPSQVMEFKRKSEVIAVINQTIFHMLHTSLCIARNNNNLLLASEMKIASIRGLRATMVDQFHNNQQVQLYYSLYISLMSVILL